ncbi:hypothetical protein LWI28_011364 [Acer negundo]|uniref:Uncharacterized protein n=1 Tax=Acer negundo TaxID=4023 RepID=A0AAD5ITI6_ACENE|nr:hypothetical protein LWI28_011364 [Acer negundo]
MRRIKNKKNNFESGPLIWDINQRHNLGLVCSCIRLISFNAIIKYKTKKVKKNLFFVSSSVIDTKSGWRKWSGFLIHVRGWDFLVGKYLLLFFHSGRCSKVKRYSHL